LTRSPEQGSCVCEQKVHRPSHRCRRVGSPWLTRAAERHTTTTASPMSRVGSGLQHLLRYQRLRLLVLLPRHSLVDQVWQGRLRCQACHRLGPSLWGLGCPRPRCPWVGRAWLTRAVARRIITTAPPMSRVGSGPQPPLCLCQLLRRSVLCRSRRLALRLRCPADSSVGACLSGLGQAVVSFLGGASLPPLGGASVK